MIGDFTQHQYLYSSDKPLILNVIFNYDDAPNADPYFTFFETLDDKGGSNWHTRIEEVLYFDGQNTVSHGKPSSKKTQFNSKTKKFHLKFKLPRNGELFAFVVDVEGISGGKALRFRAIHDPEVGNGPPE
ncbi:MAG: hypothetical protein IT473_07950 [Lysobacter sp.]|nr:hypothetical protein [Lysobacter sp.]